MTQTTEGLLMAHAAGLEEPRRQLFLGAYSSQKKDPVLAAGLSFVLGILGIDRFYLGHALAGVLKFFTAGGMLIWWAVDWFVVPMLCSQYNAQLLRELQAAYPIHSPTPQPAVNPTQQLPKELPVNISEASDQSTENQTISSDPPAQSGPGGQTEIPLALFHRVGAPTQTSSVTPVGSTGTLKELSSWLETFEPRQRKLLGTALMTVGFIILALCILDPASYDVNLRKERFEAKQIAAFEKIRLDLIRSGQFQGDHGFDPLRSFDPKSPLPGDITVSAFLVGVGSWLRRHSVRASTAK